VPSASKDTANTAARPRRPRGIPERIDHFSGGTPADTPWGDGAAGGCGEPTILGIGFEARGSMGGIPTDAACGTGGDAGCEEPASTIPRIGL
jgi:hypothetical protein